MAQFAAIQFRQFFDRQRVIDRMTQKELRVLSGTGAFGRRAVSRSIRKAPKKKVVSSGPPRWHVRGRESLKDRIFFGLADDGDSVVVGPEKFNAKGGGAFNSKVYQLVGVSTVPELLEKGGTRIVTGRGRRQNFVPRRRVLRQTYKPRPYVGPGSPAFRPTVEKMRQLMKTQQL